MVKKKANQLGRSLIKDRFNHGNRRKVDDTMVGVIYFLKRKLFVNRLIFP